MNRKAISMLLLGLGIPAFCMATSPPSGGVYILLLDRLLDVARSQSPTASLALELLERVVEGRTESIRAESETQVGLKPGDLKQKAFQGAPIREVAVWRIGETGLPEAVAFLSKLKVADFPDDPSLGIWATAQVALRNAAFVRITDRQDKVEFLRKILTEGNYATSNSGIGVWAVEELCDSGASACYQRSKSRLGGVATVNATRTTLSFARLAYKSYRAIRTARRLLARFSAWTACRETVDSLGGPLTN